MTAESVTEMPEEASDTAERAPRDPQGRAAACLGGRAPLPCLNSNISTEKASGLPQLSTQHRKSALILKESVQALSERYGIHRLGFLTLTFADHVIDAREAQKRLNSLLSHVIKPRYREYLGVMERQRSGRIHYHLLVVLDADIRSGVDFGELAVGRYTSAPESLRAEWAFWRRTARRYRFGRTELLPVKSNIEAMAKYVGKYISKHIEARTPEDKGVRLVRYSKGARIGTTRFQFKSPGSAEWRRKVAVFAEIVKARNPGEKVEDLSDLSRLMGKRWAYHHRDFILALP